MINKYLLLLFLFFFSFLVDSQTPDAVLVKVISKLNTVKDYSVSATIKANIPMIKILPNDAKIYFKQKDKFKVVSKGITILPKQGFTDINKFLTGKNYVSVINDTVVIGGVKTYLISVIPNSAGNEIILAKLWIDPESSVIMKSQITSKTNGTIVTKYTYGDQIKYGLPSKMEFEIDVKKFKLPKSVAADINKSTAESKKKVSNKGTITIIMRDYKVNQGLSDAVFK
jgi:outer membrane lipoprotein-sorting protein